jgi:hypothetical protein
VLSCGGIDNIMGQVTTHDWLILIEHAQNLFMPKLKKGFIQNNFIVQSMQIMKFNKYNIEYGFRMRWASLQH